MAEKGGNALEVPDDRAGAQSLLGVRPRTRPWLVALDAVVIALAATSAIVWHLPNALAILAALGLFRLMVMFRPPTRVSAAGISRPWRRPSTVAWSDVVHVAPGSSSAPWPQLVRRNGSVVALHDIPGDRAADVAAIGGVPLRPITLPKPPPPPVREPTEEQRAADVRARAERLAAERKTMGQRQSWPR